MHHVALRAKSPVSLNEAYLFVKSLDFMQKLWFIIGIAFYKILPETEFRKRRFPINMWNIGKAPGLSDSALPNAA